MDLLLENPKDLLRMCYGCNRIYLNLNGASSLINRILGLSRNVQWADDNHPMYQDLISIYGEEITHGYCGVCREKERYHFSNGMLRKEQII